MTAAGMTHRILPYRDSDDSARRRPLSFIDKIYLGILFSLFLLFALLLVFSRLLPTPLTGRVLNQSAGTTVNITGAVYFTCNYTLAPGTNLVSFPCIPPSFARSNFFRNLSANGSSVGAMYRYVPSRTSKWVVYNGSLPSYVVQTLSSFERYQGVYIVMTGTERFNYFGILASRETISLPSGWSLLGYPFNRTRTLIEGLTTLNDTYLRIETLEGTEESGTYLFDTPPPGEQTLNDITIYHGYWVQLNTSDTWVIVR